MTKRPTLRDVAELANVSIGTASQAINNRNNVSPVTREQVFEAARTLGYRRALEPVAKKLKTIGLLMKYHKDEPSINPFYSHIILGAERECQTRALSLMYATLEVDDDSRALGWPLMLTEQQIDGVMVVGAFLEHTIAQIQYQAETSMVLVDAYTPGQSFDSVVTDNFNGAFQAVQYLIDRGHRHIGLIGSHPDAYPSILERRAGYEQALLQNDIRHRYIQDGILTRSCAYKDTMALLRRSPEITAIFACNDDLAVGVLNAARERNLRIPEDLSVIGFDDIDIAAETSPPLTTMQVDKHRMGTQAIRLLCNRAEDLSAPVMTVSFSTRLIERDSVHGLRVST